MKRCTKSPAMKACSERARKRREDRFQRSRDAAEEPVSAVAVPESTTAAAVDVHTCTQTVEEFAMPSEGVVESTTRRETPSPAAVHAAEAADALALLYASRTAQLAGDAQASGVAAVNSLDRCGHRVGHDGGPDPGDVQMDFNCDPFESGSPADTSPGSELDSDASSDDSSSGSMGNTPTLPRRVYAFYESFQDSSHELYSMTVDEERRHAEEMRLLSDDVMKLLNYCMGSLCSSKSSCALFELLQAIHLESLKTVCTALREGSGVNALTKRKSGTALAEPDPDAMSPYDAEDAAYVAKEAFNRSSFTRYTSSQFARLLATERRCIIWREKWNVAEMDVKVPGKTKHSRLGTRDVSLKVHPGVFRRLSTLALDVVSKCGGVNCIKPWREEWRSDSNGNMERVFSDVWNSNA